VVDSKFKFDRSQGKGASFDEANDHVLAWKNKTHLERLEVSWFLICQLFSISSKTKLDRTVFSKRKHNGYIQ